MRSTKLLVPLMFAACFGGCSCSTRHPGDRSDPPDPTGQDGGSSDHDPFDNPPDHPDPISTGEPDTTGCTYTPSDFEHGTWVCPDGGTAGDGGSGGSSGSGGAGGNAGSGGSAGGDGGGDDYVTLCYFPEEGAPHEVHVKVSDIALEPDAYGDCPDTTPDGGAADGGSGIDGGSAGDGGSGGAGGDTGSGGSGSGGTGGSAGDGGNGGDGGEPPTCDDDHEKVVICHFPPGCRENAHTIHVGSSAVDAHIGHHDDHLGPCTDEEMSHHRRYY